MRKQKEINRALAVLDRRRDETSRLQADILRNKRTETWVFDQYVRCVSEENRDEALFYAARDAALYLAGKIELQALVPDMDEGEVTDAGKINEMIPGVSREMFDALARHVAWLERQVRSLQTACWIASKKAAGEQTDLIPRLEAIRYVGCSHLLLKQWANRQVVTAYRKGNRVYYSREELDANPVVQEYIRKKMERL